ncbi:MAG: TerD family protein [Pseudomonas sp.]|uniref:TerD family protein n=1 Tax=Pseudomonas sp. TaxID=306 RepID=UPI00339918D8
MTSLTPGANAAVPSGTLSVSVRFAPTQVAGADIDVSAFLLTATGKVRGDQDMIFYGQKASADGSVQLTDTAPGQVSFSLALERLDPSIDKVALTATIYENRATFATLNSLSLVVGQTGGTLLEAPIPTQGMAETALILGEFYRRQGAWKFRSIAQGFAGGLQPLAEHFGVDVAAPAQPSPAPSPAAAPQPAAPGPAAPKNTVSLSKITLDKARSSISLEKTASGFGEIRINLNWNRGTPQASKGLLSGLFGKSSNGIDLDVGCLFELADGRKGAVQALGDAFGSFEHPPFIELKGDDRTGAVSDGEWMRINGSQWDSLKRVLIYAFIYDGAPNWTHTGGVITLYVPGQPPIEVQLTEGTNNMNMCAIALLENVGGTVKVSRQVRYFKGHQEVDQAFGWGMRWAAGSKD